MRKYILTVVAFSLAFFLYSTAANALGPASHMACNMKFFEQSSSDIANLCRYYQDEFDLGSTVVDITIYDYMDEPQNYVGSHNWNFADRLFLEAEAINTDAARCIAYGAAVGHLAIDSTSHEQIVPEYIKKWNMKNIPTHWIVEGWLETYVGNNYPEAKGRASRALDMLIPSDPNYRPEYVTMIENALGNPNVDVPRRIERLDRDIDVFYKEAFTFDFADIIVKFGFLLPIGNENGEKWLGMATDNQLWLATNYGQRTTLEPHGFTSISNADATVTSLDFKILIAVILVAIIVGVVILLRFR